MQTPSPTLAPTLAEIVSRALRPALAGLFFAVLTLLFNIGLGIVFGVDEGIIKSRLNADAQAVRDSAYKGNEAALKAVVDKSWVYMQRAHLHAGGLGGTALGLILVVVLLGPAPIWTRSISLGLGVGGLSYSVYWLLAGFRAPGMGGTTAAKESLGWLAIPSSGAVLIATIAVAWLLVAALFSRPTRA